MTVQVDVDGAATVAATLGAASRDLAAMAPDDAGRYIRDQARAHAPFVSGALRSSLQFQTGEGRVAVGSGLVYAPVIHNGWPRHGISANPFLIPVAEDTQAMWGRAYTAETERIMSQVRGA